MNPQPCKHWRSMATSLALASLLLTGCGGGGGGGGGGEAGSPAVTPATVLLTGTAATGAAMAGTTVRALSAAGSTATSTVAADGQYSLRINQGGPYLLSATDAAGKTWYSYASGAGTTNITPLTTLALLDANAGKPLADLLAGWQGQQLAPNTVAQSATKVNTNLAAPMRSAGLNPLTVNIFSDPFAANHLGIDGLLDGLRVVIACSLGSCSQDIRSPDGRTVVTWNADLTTGGFSLGWTIAGDDGSVNLTVGSCRAQPVIGSVSLRVETQVFGLGLSLVPDLCVDGLQAQPGSQAGFCDDSLVQLLLPAGVQLLSCSYSAPVGTVHARIGSPVALDYTVKYSFVRH